MYIANTYIGSAYTPGDIIHDDLPADTLNWLIEAGAVREAAPAPFARMAELTETDALAEKPVEEPQDSEPDEIDEEIDVMAGIVMGAEDAPAKKPVSTASNGKKAPKGGKTK